MVLHMLQQNLNTAEKFYTIFSLSPEGQAVLETASKKFPHSQQYAQEYVLDGISSWLLEHLSDDEMDTGLLWLHTMQPDLRSMITLN